MAVLVKLGAKTYRNAKTYSVSEDAISLDPNDTNGGVGQFSASFPTMKRWLGVKGQPFVLRDSKEGITSGVVNSMTNTDPDDLQITADSRLIALTVKRLAKPYRGTLEGALRYYLGLVGIKTDVEVDSEIADYPVQFFGWEDEVFTQIAKILCPAFQMEMALVSNKIIFRPVRQRIATLRRATRISQTVADDQLAQSVTATYYPRSYRTNALAYPVGGWSPEVDVYSVNSGETSIIESIDINASLTSVEQPVCLLNVGPTYSGVSAYTVSGNDGLPIPPAMWKAYGGDLKVEVNPDSKSLKVTIVGANFPSLAPFSIAVASGESDYYSTLRIRGTGLFYDPTELTISTGLTEDEASDETGAEIDMPYVDNINDAYEALKWTVAHLHGPSQTIQVSAAHINRADESGSYAFATFADFDAYYKGYAYSFGDFDALQEPGDTFADFDDYWDQQVSSQFENQSFGNVAGARFYYKGQWFRVRSGTNQSGAIDLSAEADTTFGDFDTSYAGVATFGDFDNIWAGALMEEFNGAPLDIEVG